MSTLVVGNDDAVGTSADSFTSNSTEQQQATEAPCCYMGYCPKCETNASIEVEQYLCLPTSGKLTDIKAHYCITCQYTPAGQVLIL